MASRAQGKRGRAGTAAASTGPSRRRPLALVVLSLVLIGAFVIVAAAQGLTDPSPSGDEVAIVEDAPDGTITTEELDFWIEVAAFGQGIRRVPPPDDPQYEQLRDAGLDQAITARWVAGEAEERGVEVSEREVDEELETVINEQFNGNREEFDRFLRRSPYDEQRARDQIELSLLQSQVQEAVLPNEPPINENEIETYYEENKQQFEQPETRDVRVILTKTEDEANEALRRLERDDSKQSFKQVAKELSIDEATKGTGGLRQGLVEGQSDPELDERAFAAAEGEFVGPFETEAGFYVIRVESITPAQTTPLSEAGAQIRQTLVAARQQQLSEAFIDDFTNQWRARTFCAEDYRIERCSNAPAPPNPCTEQVAKEQGCDAPVPSIRPIQPGTPGVFGAPAPQGLPQGPITPQAGQPPAGISPLGPGGAPPIPPQGAPPPGG